MLRCTNKKSVCKHLITGKPNLGIQKLHLLTNPTRKWQKKKMKRRWWELSTTSQKRVQKGIKIIENWEWLLWKQYLWKILLVLCAVKSSVFPLFCHVVTVSVKNVFSSSGKPRKSGSVPSAGEDPQEGNLFVISCWRTYVSPSQQKALQGLRWSAVSTMSTSNSSAWKMNSRCVLCAEIQKNMPITDSGPLMKLLYLTR